MKNSKLVTRREFIKTSVLASFAGASLLGQENRRTKHNNSQPPNVVFIVCDQMRGDALSVLGSRNARTPNLDLLAKDGVLVNNCFTNNPVCAPSRVTFFSGLHPSQHGKLTNRTGEFLQSTDDTILGYFIKRGYRTGWVGKNHTYSDKALNSLDYWKPRGREPFRRYNEFVPPFWHSDTLWPAEECYATLNTIDGIDFINKSKENEPFFLHLSYFDPHPPYMAPSEYTSQYSSEQMDLPQYISPEFLSERLAQQQKALHYDRIKKTDLTETMRYYYASIEWGVDYQVGRILRALEQNNLLENTIVLFTSDHGDFMGQHHMVRKGMFLYDALLHIPMIWYAPGQIGKDVQKTNLVQGVDIFPTLIELTGGQKSNMPGRSIVPILKDESNSDPEDQTIFASAAYSDLPSNYFEDPEPAYKPTSDTPFHTRVERITWRDDHRTVMARTRDWKFILNESRPPELYHMDGGTIERKNLINLPNYRDIRNDLEQKVISFWKW